MWSPRDNNEAGMARSRVSGGGPVPQRIYAENAQNKLMYIYNTSGLLLILVQIPKDTPLGSFIKKNYPGILKE